MKKLIVWAIASVLIGIMSAAGLIIYYNSQLPKMITLADYEPLLVSDVYDRNGKKIGEFFREKRILTPFNEIPKVVVDAFLAAEDASFYQHGGINYFAILRSIAANLRAGDKVQGASTITQQVARSIILQSREKTYARKIKEVLLSYKMEQNLSKEDILYLYLNQIFLGQNAYGVATATEIYFDKPLKDITLPEAAILAGLPKAPSAYSPLRNPSRAKERQRYVISRMQDENLISKEEALAAVEAPVLVYERKTYWDKAPHFLETVRQMLISEIGEEMVLDKGIKVYTSLDLDKQKVAQEQIQLGLRELDKRQGYRGVLANTDNPEEIAKLLVEERNRLLDIHTPYKILQPDGTLPDYGPLVLTDDSAPAPSENVTQPKSNLPDYLPVGTLLKGVVTLVDDTWGLVFVRFAESKGLIDVENMKWARAPDPNVDSRWAEEIKLPSKVLKKGDIIEIRVTGSRFNSERIDQLINDKKKNNKKFELPNDFPDFKKYTEVELEQTPETQAALLALEQKTGDIISMVGGYDFSSRNQLNRAIQSIRQTGSSFKPLVYLSALDKDFTPSTLILDAPIVYEEELEVEGAEDQEVLKKKWKPTNHSNRFMGDILFRTALIQSLNVPSVKIIEKLGVNWAADYARRLGVFSPLNLDYTLALGSSSVTLYEMVKAYAQIGRLGQKINPIIIHKVTDRAGTTLLERLPLDSRFKDELEKLNENFELRRQNFLAWEKSQKTGEPFKPIYQASPTPEGEGDAALAKFPDPSKEPPIFFEDPNQLVKPQTAYVMTSLLQGVVEEEGGTGQRAKALGRPTAGKTGTTSGYYDAWFMGYTQDVAAGVWVGYDQEKTLGKGEVGGRAALPIWVEYMKAAHENLPVRNFQVPDGVVFSSIDNDTGRLAASSSKSIIRQAYLEGTEPKELEDDRATHDTETQDFYKEDLAD